MHTDFYFPSCGGGMIHGCRWEPEGKPKAVIQIVHGIAEFVERYDAFANYLTELGIVVVAEDHMGHGQSINGDGIQGYFHGGWFNAVADTYRLLPDTKAEYPDLPYILFGHSMGSFMARTVLCKYPDSGIAGAIICGTGWQLTAAVPVMRNLVSSLCRDLGDDQPDERLQGIIFGKYNKKVKNPRTAYDWLTRDDKIVDEYIAHPLCGFTATRGLMRDMIDGIYYIQQSSHLEKMRKDLPVFFIAGGEDPVGSYGRGIHKAVKAFRKTGMQNVSVRLYPDCRHEILNEINKEEIFEDVAAWIGTVI